MKPIVCITPSLFQGPDKGHQLINMKYAKMVRRSGALPVMCDYPSDPAEVAELLDVCQGLLLTGGYDIDPARYGEERLECPDDPDILFEQIGRTFEATPGREVALPQRAQARIIFVTRGSLTLRCPQSVVDLHQGDSAFLSAEDVEVSARGDGQAFLASPGLS